MYKELKKFKNTNHFIYTTDNHLEQVCNAPEFGAGIFLVFDAKEVKKTLLMVGSTGTVQNNGILKAKNG